MAYKPTGRPRGRPKKITPEREIERLNDTVAVLKEIQDAIEADRPNARGSKKQSAAERMASKQDKEKKKLAEQEGRRITEYKPFVPNVEKFKLKMSTDDYTRPRPGGAVRTLDLGELNVKQRMFCESNARYTCYGGARGGGKSHVVRIKAVGGCMRYPGIKVLIVRKTFPDLQGNHIEPISKMVPTDLASYNGTLHTLYFKNGSMIRFGHYNSEAAETEYQGQEYDWIFLDEATQFTERQFRILGALLRGVNQIPKRFYLTCNPGGVGHRWVKRLFIDRDFKPEENPKDYCFIKATVDDNIHLMAASPEYVQALDLLPEHIRQAHRYGDWDVLSGSYFPEFSENYHVTDVTENPIKPHWLRYRAFDYGLDMFACLWVAVDEQGRCYVYRELCKSGLIVQEAAQMMLDNTAPSENISITFAPPDMWSRQKDTGKTMAEVFLLNGVSIVRADNNRVQGHLQIKEMLAPLKDGKPGIYIYRDCKQIIECLQAIQTDEKNPNDCAKEPHEITHIVDALRYFAVSRTLKSEAIASMNEEPEEDNQQEEYEDFMTGGEANSNYLTY